jgi:hypothetical protein
VLEMNNYYDVQRPERDNKVSKAVTFVIDHVFEWGLGKIHNSLRWWQT